jgi:hypothetical protein
MKKKVESKQAKGHEKKETPKVKKAEKKMYKKS